MGGRLITNDTLQITREQGFPKDLDFNKHKDQPFTTDMFKGRLFTFTKPELRFYQPHGIRVWLVENIKGKWLYWGSVYVHRVTLDYVKNTTSGEFEIVDLLSPTRMKEAFIMRDGRAEFDYLA